MYTRTYTRSPDHFCIGKEFPDPFLHFMAGNMAQFSISSHTQFFIVSFLTAVSFLFFYPELNFKVHFLCERQSYLLIKRLHRSTVYYWIFNP